MFVLLLFGGFALLLVAVVLLLKRTPQATRRGKQVGVMGLVLGVAGVALAPENGTVTSAQFGDEWPLTVDRGVLSCQREEVTSGLGTPALRAMVRITTPDGAVYGLNAAGQKASPGIEKIWKDAMLHPVKAIATDVPEPARKAAYVALVECEEKNPDNIDACPALVARERNLSDANMKLIADEGLAKSWPPLDPYRVSLQPLIQAGLALCEN